MDYFIVLSGFVTHWAARGKFSQSANRWPDAKRWYGRRFGRVLLAVWLAMAVSAILLYLGGNGDLNVTHFRHALFSWNRSVWNQMSGAPRHRRDLISTQVLSRRWCPTVILDCRGPRAAWLLYPVLYDPFLYERRHLMVVAVALATVPSFVALLFVSGGLRAGAYFNNSAHTALYLWPPAQLADFLLGCVSAELAARSQREKTAWLADGAVVIITLAVLLVPNPHLDYREHAEILYDHGLAPLFALFLWAASRDTAAASKASKLFAHPAFSSIGKCSFEVYLFQWPIQQFFTASA